ncbi:hypothetical protein AEGHOMDF_3433 [Methylobacterium soli]|nr:hypothetical protein AEGHOMDF_3433 [Methylobacterium soli]
MAPVMAPVMAAIMGASRPGISASGVIAAGRRGERIRTPGLDAATSMRLWGRAAGASMSRLARAGQSWAGQSWAGQSWADQACADGAGAGQAEPVASRRGGS